MVRDGEVSEIAVEDVVLDDLLELRTGDQVPADGTVRGCTGLEIDESLLTGESDAVEKVADSEVMSGSFVVAGSGRFQATGVGADAYAVRLAADARRFTLVKSELVDGINFLLRLIQYALFPVAALLLVRQLASHEVQAALTGTVAGVVGMVPEGLVLLTSLAFGIAAITLARRNVLVQELPAVEGLPASTSCASTRPARSPRAASSSTGSSRSEAAAQRLLRATNPWRRCSARSPTTRTATPRSTRSVTRSRHPAGRARAQSRSRRRASGARRASTATAPGCSARPRWSWPSASTDDPARRRADELAADGSRVLLLAHSDAALGGDELPADLSPASLVLLDEKVRPDAAETLAYFAEQGVTLKVISGDNPRTVAAVARRVGLAGAESGFDARQLPEDRDELAEALEQHSVFGRVTPQQKRAMVGALQSRGHVVAMTGDGVNDALALKDADIGVAMGSGAPATRAWRSSCCSTDASRRCRGWSPRGAA